MSGEHFCPTRSSREYLFAYADLICHHLQVTVPPRKCDGKCLTTYSQCHIPLTSFSDCASSDPGFSSVNPNLDPTLRLHLIAKVEEVILPENIRLVTWWIIMTSKGSERIWIWIQWMPLNGLCFHRSTLFLFRMEIHPFCKSFIDFWIEPYFN